MKLEIIQENDELTHVAFSGRLDTADVQQVNAEFAAHTVERQKPVIVDIAGVNFLGSMAMGMLLSNAKKLYEAGSIMVLLNPQKLVEFALKQAGLLKVIRIAHSMPEALELVRRP